MKKQIFLFVMLLLPMVTSAFVGDAEIDGINYNIVTKAKTAEVIAKSSGKYSGDIVIPATVEYEGFVCDVTSIRGSAFSVCSGLTSITIPNSVTCIGSDAFYGCSGLTSVTIPNSVTIIGDYAFEGCSGLTSVTIPNSVTSIGSGAFFKCSSLTSVTIPNSLTSIGGSTFYYCSALTSVTIPNSVKSIGNYAFRYCTNLASITIGSSVESIGNSAFECCYNLESITISSGVTSIGDKAFLFCGSLTLVQISDLKAWCEIKFSDYNSNPLNYAKHLYLDGEEVKDMVILDGVTSIGDYAFWGCSGLTSVIIPNSVTSIGKTAFYGCSGLTSVTIGSGVTRIYGSAFANCSELTNVYCYAEKVPSTESDAFQDSYIEYVTLHVPAASVSLYQQKTPWSGFKSIVAISGETPEVKKCATPTIAYTNGKIVFDCETEDVEYISQIKAADVIDHYDGEIVPTNKYIVTVYATKTGYENSDVVTGEITIGGSGTGIKGDVNEDGAVDVEDVVGVVNIILDK